MTRIIYDGDCPFCRNYLKYLKLKNTLPDLILEDIRTQPQLACELQQQGYNLDQGMLLEIDDQRYFGEDALHRIALLSTSSSWLNKINRWLLQTKLIAILLYPLLRLGRNFTLLMLGKPSIHPPPAAVSAHIGLFNCVFATFCLLHVFVYQFQFGRPSWLTALGISATALILLFRPLSRLAFIALIVACIVSAISQMPVSSNHTLIKNFFVFSFVAIGFYHALRGHAWSQAHFDWMACGRVLLLGMYFFGILHKINTDFLNPDVSCAVVLWREMPYFLSWLDFSWFHYLTIYGTFLSEALIAVLLLSKRLRHYGIISGIAFHALLGLSGYAMYPPFSMLCIALHCCFLAPSAALRITQSPELMEWKRIALKPSSLLVVIVFTALLIGTAYIASYSSFGVLWLLGTLPLTFLIIKYGADQAALAKPSGLIPKGILWSVTLLFLFNGFTPYLGLKTAQSINMFANLRLEQGISNHLVFRNAPGPFRYLNDIVTITASSGAPYFHYIETNDLHLVYYDLLNHLERNPHASVSFIREGVHYQQQTALTLQQDIEQVLHPRWFRSFFHFNSVDLTRPKPCALDR